MQIVPQYARFSFDHIPGNMQYTREEAADLLDKFSQHRYISVRPLLENLVLISGGGAEEPVFAAFAQFIRGLRGDGHEESRRRRYTRGTLSGQISG